MHEFSVAEELLKAVLEELAKLDGRSRLLDATVVVGGMQDIVPDNLSFAFEALAAGTAAEGAGLNIVEIPVVAECPLCGWRGEIHGIAFLCGGCGASRISVVQGRELYLDRIGVETDGET